MSVTLLDEITGRVNKMEDEGKVDLDILHDLDKLKDGLLAIEDKWVNNSSRDSFYFYQAIRNVELILERVVERFAAAKERHDNPQIALDTLAIIPIASDIIQLTESGAVEHDKIDRVLERTRQLRDKAAETSLIESDARNLKDVDSEEVGHTFDQIMERLDIPADLPNDIVVDDKE